MLFVWWRAHQKDKDGELDDIWELFLVTCVFTNLQGSPWHWISCPTDRGGKDYWSWCLPADSERLAPTSRAQQKCSRLPRYLKGNICTYPARSCQFRTTSPFHITQIRGYTVIWRVSVYDLRREETWWLNYYLFSDVRHNRNSLWRGPLYQMYCVWILKAKIKILYFLTL